MFGKVIRGMEIVLTIPERDPARAKMPGTSIEAIEIHET
jgi:hypothetical protein